MSRILVIDDDKFVRISIRAVLETAGYDVDDVGGANEGLTLQRLTSFDAAIVDLMMPHKDGLETIRELRQYEADLPILAISGGGDIVRKNFVKAAEMFGANATLEKPFEGEDLLSTVASIIANKASTACCA